jgi:rRNA-processing protein EBP2
VIAPPTERQDGSAPTTATEEADLFDVALDDTLSKPDSRRDQRREKGAASKRQKKNEKFGFGGKKRFSKSGDALSSGDLTGFSTRKMKGKAGRGGGAAKRPGKARRAGARR